MQGLGSARQNAVAPASDNNGAALLGDFFNQLAGQAGELAVFEPQRRRDIIGAFKAADAKRLNDAFDKRAHALVFGFDIILGNMLLGGNGPDNFLVPDFPVEALAKVAGNQASPAAVLVRQREQGDGRIHNGSFLGVFAIRITCILGGREQPCQFLSGGW